MPAFYRSLYWCKCKLLVLGALSISEPMFLSSFKYPQISTWHLGGSQQTHISYTGGSAPVKASFQTLAVYTVDISPLSLSHQNAQTLKWKGTSLNQQKYRLNKFNPYPYRCPDMSAVLCRSCAPTELCLLKQSHLFGVPRRPAIQQRSTKALLKEVCIFEYFEYIDIIYITGRFEIQRQIWDRNP